MTWTRWLRALWAVLALVALAYLGLALARQFDAVRARLGELTVWWLLLAGATVLVALWCMMMSWRTVLADLGSPLPPRAAARIYFLGQLGKYLPGTVWPVLAQMKLGRDYAVPRARSAAAAALTIGLSVVAALSVAAVTLGLAAAGTARHYWWAFALLPAAAALHPRLLNPTLDRLLRLARRAPLEHPLSPAGVARGVGWLLVAWTLLGVQIWVLALDAGAAGVRVLPVAIGAFALAWVSGFLLGFIFPTGVGARETALVVALAPVLPVQSGAGILVALVSRLLLTASDLAWGGAALLATRRPTPTPEPEGAAATSKAPGEPG